MPTWTNPVKSHIHWAAVHAGWGCPRKRAGHVALHQIFGTLTQEKATYNQSYSLHKPWRVGSQLGAQDCFWDKIKLSATTSFLDGIASQQCSHRNALWSHAASRPRLSDDSVLLGSPPPSLDHPLPGEKLGETGFRLSWQAAESRPAQTYNC